MARLVGLTAGHATGDDDPDGELLCDADLAILAADEERYAAYTAAIRREYAHVPDDAFKAGRAQVLKALLELPSIYRLAPLRAAWEERARRQPGGRAQRLRCFGRRRPAARSRAASSRGGSRVAPSHSAGLEPEVRDVVVVAVERSPRRAQHLGEHVQFLVRQVADQVRPEPAPPRPARLVDEDQRSTWCRSTPRSAANPRASGTPSRAASAVRSSGIFCDWRSASTRAR